VEKLNRTIEAALVDPAGKAKLAIAGIELLQSSPASFADYIESETRMSRGVIRAAGISPVNISVRSSLPRRTYSVLTQ
jgi:tripartite-type tricarboxylate transporter receptor subunit TctC